MGDLRPDCAERPYRVVIAEDANGVECVAMLATRERMGEEPEEILLGLDENVFKLWVEQMTDDEIFGYGASAALMQIAKERRGSA